MESTMRGIILICLVGQASMVFDSIMDAAKRLIYTNSTVWLMDQPESHQLTKGIPGTFNLLDIRHPSIVFLHNNNMSHLGPFRDYDCGHDRTSLTVLNPETAKIVKYSCNSSQYLSRDCQRCEAGGRNHLIHADLVYDDAICQADYTKDWINIPHDTRICQINKLKIRDCKIKKTRMETVSWIRKDGEIRIIEDYQVVWREGEFLTLFDCRNLTGTFCSKDVCTLGKCSGDASFCSNFNCEKNSPECICKRNEVPGVAVFKFRNVEVIPLCFGRSRWLVQREEVKRDVVSEHDCVDCSMDCKKDRIEITVRHFQPDFYRACLGSTCLTGKASDSDFTVPFKMADRMTNREFHVRIWDKLRDHVYKLEGSCEAIGACEVIHCFFCWANWANVHCFSKEQSLIIILAGSVCVILLASVLRAIKTVATMTWKLLLPFISCIRLLWRFTRFIIKRKKKIVQEKMRDIEQGIETEDQSTMPLISNSRNQSRSAAYQKQKKIMTLLGLSIIMSFGNISECCTDLVTVTAESRTCINPGNGKGTCYFSTNSLLEISPRGQESCMILKNSGGEVVDVLKIKTEEIKLECEKSDLYWTPRVTHKCLGTRRCHLMGECKGDYCANFKLDDYSPEWGDKQELMNTLGWSFCAEQCGGALCQCFNLNPSCYFYRKTFQPLGPEVFNMFECSEWSYRLHLTVANNVSAEKVVLKLGVPYQIKDGLISLHSISQPPSVGFDRCFGESETGVKFHAICNKRQEYTLGKLGEIQCPTKIDAQRISSHCLSSESLVNAKVHIDDLNCFSSIIDPGDIQKRNKLPANVGGVTFYPTQSSVEAAISDLASASLMIKLVNFRVDFTVDLAKCSTRFVSLKGCYNCEQGAVLTVNTVSNFGTALALLDCPSLDYTTYLEVNSHLTEVDRIIHLNKSHIYDKCTVICPNSKDSIIISGELVYLFNEDLRHSNQTVMPGMKPKMSSGWDPFGWMKASWMRIVWALIGSSLSVIIAIVVIYIILNMACKVKRH
ncbi:glycoprotein precursor [Rukutama virus]|uniref:Envelopment polyprotein n=1 Tax=Rukutama virus TaxID=1531287 RepID=A0A076JU25_9VIRU|nr:glycoprotein precursor [Rukutama virus]AII79366.1 glycoprotein precursor [Rukutama virus]